MGRVYDALKRAESAPRDTTSKSPVPTRRDGNSDNVSLFVRKNSGNADQYVSSAVAGGGMNVDPYSAPS